MEVGNLLKGCHHHDHTKRKFATAILSPLGTCQSLASHVDVVAWHQHRQRQLANISTGLQCHLSASPVGCPCVPACHYYPDRQRRKARRHHGSPTADAGRDIFVYSGLCFMRCRSHALAADCRPSSARARRGRYDGSRRGDGR